MKRLLIIISLFITSQVEAQNIHMGYWGELMTHPGIKVAYDYPITGIQKEKEVKNKTISRNHQWLVGSELGVYKHPQNHSGMILGITSGYRYERTKQKSGKKKKILRTDISFGAGYYRYFLAGTTYQFQEDGSIESQNSGGSGSFMPSGSVSFSMNIPNQKDIPLFWYFKPSFYLETQHNTGVNYKPFLEVGFSYQFK